MNWLDQSTNRKEGIELVRKTARDEYPTLWQSIISEWRNWNGPDSLWLTYSANYLFHTAGLKWAIDPFHLSARLDGMEPPDYAADLDGLALIVLTHIHADHVDWQLIQSLSRTNIRWVIPDAMLDLILAEIKLPLENIIVPKINSPIRIGPLSLLPFDGLHFRGQNGVPEMGYLAGFNGKRWLFPGDTRRYDARRMPVTSGLDGMVTHLWLGKGAASMKSPPFLNEYCDFCTDIHPSKLVIAHLYEFGRDENDLWDKHHFQMVLDRLNGEFDTTGIECGLMGDRILLE